MGMPAAKLEHLGHPTLADLVRPLPPILGGSVQPIPTQVQVCLEEQQVRHLAVQVSQQRLDLVLLPRLVAVSLAQNLQQAVSLGRNLHSHLAACLELTRTRDLELQTPGALVLLTPVLVHHSLELAVLPISHLALVLHSQPLLLEQASEEPQHPRVSEAEDSLAIPTSSKILPLGSGIHNQLQPLSVASTQIHNSKPPRHLSLAATSKSPLVLSLVQRLPQARVSLAVRNLQTTPIPLEALQIRKIQVVCLAASQLLLAPVCLAQPTPRITLEVVASSVALEATKTKHSRRQVPFLGTTTITAHKSLRCLETLGTNNREVYSETPEISNKEEVYSEFSTAITSNKHNNLKILSSAEATHSSAARNKAKTALRNL
jgi:hypothetical protein